MIKPSLSTMLCASIEQSTYAIFMTTVDGYIVYVNARFCAMTGYCAEEILGKRPDFLNSGKTPPTVHEAIWHAVKNGHSWTGELYNRRKTGELYCCRETIYPIKDSTDQVTHLVAVSEDISAIRPMQSRIDRLAYYDLITDLPNRRLLHDRLTQALTQMRQGEGFVALLYIDLDHFKHINEWLGHETGDELLKAVGKRLCNIVDKRHTVARIGGDEFVILCPKVLSMTELDQLVRLIFNRLSEAFQFNGRSLYIGASIGIALYPHDGQESGVLLMNAELAMYYAKHQGRNNYQFYTDEMNTRAYERMTLEHDLRHALEYGHLLVHYQPRLRISDQHVVGVEALVRWQYGDQGLISPARFIPLAEENGLIIPIGEWVLERACQQAKQWQASSLLCQRVAVNLSARQFRQQDLLIRILCILERAGLDPESLELELTETMIMDNTDEAIRILRSLKKLGVRIAIDDFGTGYSSLSQLKRLPIDVLKIDQSFIRDLTEHPDNAAITSTIITMAHNLRLAVVAEGVETAAQLAFLQNQGCHEAQGYYFSPPLSALELETYLQKGNRNADAEK